MDIYSQISGLRREGFGSSSGPFMGFFWSWDFRKEYRPTLRVSLDGVYSHIWYLTFSKSLEIIVIYSVMIPALIIHRWWEKERRQRNVACRSSRKHGPMQSWQQPDDSSFITFLCFQSSCYKHWNNQDIDSNSKKGKKPEISVDNMPWIFEKLYVHIDHTLGSIHV